MYSPYKARTHNLSTIQITHDLQLSRGGEGAVECRAGSNDAQLASLGEAMVRKAGDGQEGLAGMQPLKHSLVKG